MRVREAAGWLLLALAAVVASVAWVALGVHAYTDAGSRENGGQAIWTICTVAILAATGLFLVDTSRTDEDDEGIE